MRADLHVFVLPFFVALFYVSFRNAKVRFSLAHDDLLCCLFLVFLFGSRLILGLWTVPPREKLFGACLKRALPQALDKSSNGYSFGADLPTLTTTPATAWGQFLTSAHPKDKIFHIFLVLNPCSPFFLRLFLFFCLELDFRFFCDWQAHGLIFLA